MVNLQDSMMGGPDINGPWYNKRTGKIVIIRDSFMDDEGMKFMTADGDMIDGEEFSRDYIQCDSTVYDENGNSTGVQEEVDYDAMFTASYQNLTMPEETPVTKNLQTSASTIPSVENKKFDMLNTLFGKLKHVPIVTASIKWQSVPYEELNMLKSYFDIENTDIADYVYEKFCTEPEIKKAILDGVISLLSKKKNNI